MIKWTSRKFSFDFPAEMMPIILTRLKGTVPRLEALTKNLSKDQLTKRIDNAWSIQEHIGHLIDLEELHEGRIDDFLNKADVLRAADMSNKKTYRADHNSRDLKELLSDLTNARTHFIQRLLLLNPEQSAIHPRLQKPMRVVDMAFFVAEHDDQHIAIVDCRLLIED